MALTITLPDELAEKLEQVAAEQQLSIDETVGLILREVLQSEDFFPTPEQVVAKIKALPKNPQAIIPPQGSLAEYLRNSPADPNFDLEAWKREWAAVEAEMKAMELADAISEGRR